MRTIENPWLQGTFAPVDDERDDRDLRVTGALPDGLQGTFLRNGPNAMFPPVARYHLFDGDGMLHGFYFENGRVDYRNRWVRTLKWQREREAGREATRPQPGPGAGRRHQPRAAWRSSMARA